MSTRDDALAVWVFQTGEPLPHLGGSARPMRAANVTDALIAAGHRVTLWSSDFNHQSGRHFTGEDSSVRLSDQLEVRLVHSRGYQRNIGPGRVIDHAQLAHGLRRRLRDASPPDVAFVGYPPIEPAAVLTRWLRAHAVPTLLDVKDQWPDVYLRALPTSAQPLGRVALSGYRHLGRRAMRDATGITSISQPFLEWSLAFAGRPECGADRVVPLTSRPPQIDAGTRAEAERFWDDLGVRPGQLRVAYVGTLSTGLDVDSLVRAARTSDHQFVICGTGSTESVLRNALADRANVVMPGWIDSAQASVLADRTTLALAPYVPEAGFAMSLPNKVFDSLSYGIPLVSSIDGLVQQLIATEGVGHHYSDPTQLGEIITQLLSKPADVTAMRTRARALYDTRFSYDIVYSGLVDHMERLASDSRSRRIHASRL